MLTRILGAGTVVAGRFTIVREVGRGATGVVYVVEHVGTRSQFALKLLHDGLTITSDRAKRFRREARALARAKGENVVAVIDADTAPELRNAPFLVMELLSGEDLEKALRARGKMPSREAIEILEQVARGLDAAHAAGVVHRDLKPENIFLHRRDDETVVPKLLDFGFSKTLGGGDSENSIQTAAAGTTSVLGTPLYMAPEQASVRHGEITSATDVWAFGLLAVRLLTGHDYWHAETMTELVIQILAEDRTPPSTKFPELTHAFDVWFAKSCALHPADRFQSAGEQVRALSLALHAATNATIEPLPAAPA